MLFRSRTQALLRFCPKTGAENEIRSTAFGKAKHTRRKQTPPSGKENTTIPKETTEQITTAEDQLAQERHRLQRMENRQKYLGDKTRKQRAHRLITRGAAVESVFPDVKDLSEPEFYELVEHASEIPAVISLVMDAAEKHNQSVAKKEVI